MGTHCRKVWRLRWSSGRLRRIADLATVTIGTRKPAWSSSLWRAKPAPETICSAIPGTVAVASARRECSSGECCDGCRFRGLGYPCGNQASSVCDFPDSCDGAGVCLANYVPASVKCRNSGGECDVDDTCNGSGLCPDNKKANGTAVQQCGQQSMYPGYLRRRSLLRNGVQLRRSWQLQRRWNLYVRQRSYGSGLFGLCARVHELSPLPLRRVFTGRLLRCKPMLACAANRTNGLFRRFRFHCLPWYGGGPQPAEPRTSAARMPNTRTMLGLLRVITRVVPCRPSAMARRMPTKS